MQFPSYIHDAAPIDDRRVLVLRANPHNLSPGVLELWDVTSGDRIWNVSAEAQLAHVLAVRGERAASGDSKGGLRIWDVSDGKCLQHLDTRIRKEDVSVGALAFLDDHRLLVGSSAGFDLWDLRAGACVATHAIDRAWVMGFAITPQRDRIVTACSDRTVKVWDATSGRCLRTMKEAGLPKSVARNEATDMHAATSVCLLRDGQRAVASYGDGSLRCWSLENGKLLQKARVRGNGPPWLLSVAASPVQDLIVAGSWDTHVWVWNLKDDPVAMAGHIGEAGPVFFLDEARVVSVSFDQTVRVWDVARMTSERVIGQPVQSSRFPPNESMW